MVLSLTELYPSILKTRPAISPHRADWPKSKFKPTETQLQIGKTKVVVLVFWEAGNVLPLHSHPPGEAHLTMVNAGRLRIFGEGWERIVEPGEVLKFEPDAPHAYEALEPMSRITNIIY